MSSGNHNLNSTLETHRSVMTSSEVTTPELETLQIVLNDTIVNEITGDPDAKERKQLPNAQALFLAIERINTLVKAIDPHNNVFQDNTVISKSLLPTSFITDHPDWEAENFTFMDRKAYYSGIAGDDNYLKIRNEFITDLGKYFLVISISRLDGGKLIIQDEYENILGTISSLGTHYLEVVVTDETVAMYKFIIQGATRLDTVIIDSIRFHKVTDRIYDYFDYRVGATGGADIGVSQEYVDRAIQNLSMQVAIALADKTDVDTFNFHKQDRDSNPHDISPQMIHAATDDHTHTPQEIGAATADHTHALEELHAAHENHTHIPMDIGAADRDHNHDGLYAPLKHQHTDEDLTGVAKEIHEHDAAYSKLGHKHGIADLTDVAAANHNHDTKYADILHTHSLIELGAADRDHTHDPESIGAADRVHTHDVSDINDAISVTTVNSLINSAMSNFHYASSDYSQVIIDADVSFASGDVYDMLATAQVLQCGHTFSPVGNNHNDLSYGEAWTTLKSGNVAAVAAMTQPIQSKTTEQMVVSLPNITSAYPPSLCLRFYSKRTVKGFKIKRSSSVNTAVLHVAVHADDEHIGDYPITYDASNESTVVFDEQTVCRFLSFSFPSTSVSTKVWICPIFEEAFIATSPHLQVAWGSNKGSIKAEYIAPVALSSTEMDEFRNGLKTYIYLDNESEYDNKLVPSKIPFQCGCKRTGYPILTFKPFDASGKNPYGDTIPISANSAGIWSIYTGSKLITNTSTPVKFRQKLIQACRLTSFSMQFDTDTFCTKDAVINNIKVSGVVDGVVTPIVTEDISINLMKLNGGSYLSYNKDIINISVVLDADYPTNIDEVLFDTFEIEFGMPSGSSNVTVGKFTMNFSDRFLDISSGVMCNNADISIKSICLGSGEVVRDHVDTSADDSIFLPDPSYLGRKAVIAISDLIDLSSQASYQTLTIRNPFFTKEVDITLNKTSNLHSVQYDPKFRVKSVTELEIELVFEFGTSDFNTNGEPQFFVQIERTW